HAEWDNYGIAMVRDFINQAIFKTGYLDLHRFGCRDWINVEYDNHEEVIRLLADLDRMDFVLLRYLDDKKEEIRRLYEHSIKKEDPELIKKFFEKPKDFSIIDSEEKMHLINREIELKNLDVAFNNAREILRDVGSEFILSLNPNDCDVNKKTRHEFGRHLGNQYLVGLNANKRFVEEDYQEFKKWLASAEEILGKKFTSKNFESLAHLI
ncbi:MAG: hypothetical protein ACRD9Q_04455, partial [Nitrososphaeraceae archaeon]